MSTVGTLYFLQLKLYKSQTSEVKQLLFHLHFRTIRVSTVPLSAVAFSREGDAVAIASQTGTVYIFDATRDGYAYKKSGNINCGNNLQSLDWSEDSDHIQVTKNYGSKICK